MTRPCANSGEPCECHPGSTAEAHCRQELKESRPAWAPTCTCGQTPLGYFCYPCHAWAGSSHGEQASWSRPRQDLPSGSSAPTPTPELIPQGEAVDPAPSDTREDGMPCKNGRHSRLARAGEKLLPCGCPLGGAPRECIDAVATKTVTVKRRGLDH